MNYSLKKLHNLNESQDIYSSSLPNYQYFKPILHKSEKELSGTKVNRKKKIQKSSQMKPVQGESQKVPEKKKVEKKHFEIVKKNVPVIIDIPIQKIEKNHRKRSRKVCKKNIEISSETKDILTDQNNPPIKSEPYKSNQEYRVTSQKMILEMTTFLHKKDSDDVRKIRKSGIIRKLRERWGEKMCSSPAVFRFMKQNRTIVETRVDLLKIGESRKEKKIRKEKVVKNE